MNEGTEFEDDAFVMKLDSSSGAIQWVTQLGDTTKDPDYPSADNSGDDRCDGVSVDGSGNVYCAGYTNGNLGEANAGSEDVFVMKLNSSGVIEWVTSTRSDDKADGGDNSRQDACLGVAVDGSSNVYCAGYTYGGLGEANAGLVDAFVMKLNSDGTFELP